MRVRPDDRVWAVRNETMAGAGGAIGAASVVTLTGTLRTTG